MQSFHLTFVTVGRHPMFADEASRRAALHALGRVLAQKVVLFALVDDHLHVVLYVSPAEVGHLARAILLALGPLAAVPVHPAHVAAVEDQEHLTSLVRYLLEQSVSHGLDEHPALASGSCYAELVGARVVPGLELQVERAFLDRRVPDTAPFVGLPSTPLEPSGPSVVRHLGAFRLAAAAAFAAAAPSNLEGRSAECVAARRVVACLGDQASIDSRELAAALGVDPDTVRRLQTRAADPVLARATCVRLALEQRVVLACRRATIRAMAEEIARRKVQKRVKASA
jgi:hypothetical protein